MEIINKKFIELYFFVLSLYLSSFVLLNQKLNEYNKSKYLNNTLLKFEGKNIDDINKRIALLELYEKTSNAYDKGIRIDKEEFKRKEIEKSYLKVNKD